MDYLDLLEQKIFEEEQRYDFEREWAQIKFLEEKEKMNGRK